MSGILGKIFSKGAEALVGSIGEAIDRNITSKDEREKNNIELQKIVTAHIQEMEKQSNEVMRLEVEDRSSARLRETEFVKATGHIDYLMWTLAVSGLAIFGYMTWFVLNKLVPAENEKLIYHLFGIIEGVVLSIFGYFFGSSAGSRIKDMKK